MARLLGVGDDPLWRILEHRVGRARARAEFGEVRAVGIDETASRRGQRYITVFHDLEAGRVLFACPGRDRSTVERFVEDLEAHGGSREAIEAVCTDISKASIAGVAGSLPAAELTFDRCHVVALANQAVDEVRRAQVKTSPELRGTRWVWLNSARRWSYRQIQDFHHLSRTRLRTARSWRRKEALRDIYQCCRSPGEARGAFEC